VRTGSLGVDLESVGPREVGGVEAPKASRTDFTGVIVPQASITDIKGNGTELGAGGRSG
jgi:hypothetical protein